MMKLFAALVALAGLGVAVAIVIGGRGPAADKHDVVPLTVASPADSFIVHDAPPPPPATPAPPASPAPGAPTDPNATAPGALDAAIERLRAAAAANSSTVASPAAPTNPPTAPASPPPASVTAPAATVPPDPLLNGSNPPGSALAGPPPQPAPPPPPPPPSWTAVTSQGARWRTAQGSGGPVLVIDMGGGRAATVHVDPAFLGLPQAGANSRVDFLKQTILESFPPGASEFRFARDGSVSLVR